MVARRGTEVRPEGAGFQDLTPPEAHVGRVVARGQRGLDPRRLAKAPAALYPEGSEEKPLLDAELTAGSWDGYISALVLEEVSRAHDSVRRRIATVLDKSPVTVLDESEESVALAQAYIAAGAIPSDFEDDARHVAIATLNDINVIVSWNFRHMVNIERKRRINSVNLREGCPLIDIVSPWEISHEEA